MAMTLTIILKPSASSQPPIHHVETQRAIKLQSSSTGLVKTTDRTNWFIKDFTGAVMIVELCECQKKKRKEENRESEGIELLWVCVGK